MTSQPNEHTTRDRSDMAGLTTEGQGKGDVCQDDLTEVGEHEGLEAGLAGQADYPTGGSSTTRKAKRSSLSRS